MYPAAYDLDSSKPPVPSQEKGQGEDITCSQLVRYLGGYMRIRVLSHVLADCIFRSPPCLLALWFPVLSLSLLVFCYGKVLCCRQQTQEMVDYMRRINSKSATGGKGVEGIGRGSQNVYSGEEASFICSDVFFRFK